MARSRISSMIGFVKEDGPYHELPSVRTGVFRVLWWMVVFLAVCLLIKPYIPRPPESWTSAKLEAFVDHKDEYDLLFLGSSQIYRHADPARFDALLADAGHELRSFNFGVPGMGALENRWVLQQVLEMEPANLRYIVFDAPLPGLLLSGNNHTTPRAKTWHDLESTRLAVEMAAATGMPFDWKVDMARRHLVSFGYRLCNVGSLREIVDPWMRGTPATRAEEEQLRFTFGPGGLGPEGAAGDGWVSLNEAYKHASGYERKLLRDRNNAMKQGLPRFMEQLEADPHKPRVLLRPDGKPRAVQELTGPERQTLEDLVALAEARGIAVVFTNAPDVRQKDYFIKAAEAEGVIPTLLDMDDFERYPQLFDPDLRFDEMHLNKDGAELYTRALANAFAAWLDARGDD